jgi:hypothetical protein
MPSPSLSVEAYLFIEVRDRAYRYKLREAVTTVGSAEDNHVRIKEPSVSAHHLLVTWVDGKFHLRRVEEAGVHLNGERLENWSEELRYGDVVRIGDVRLRLAEGGRSSDGAVLVLASLPGDGATRPWMAWASRKREIFLGGAGSDLVLPGVEGHRLLVENFGAAGTWAMPVDGATGTVHLNEVVVERRTRLKDKDVLRTGGATLKLRLLRGEVLDDPEALLWPDVLKRLTAPEVHPG